MARYALSWIVAACMPLMIGSSATATRGTERAMTGKAATYTTVAGDSLVSVGARFGVDTATLALDNQLRRGVPLAAGQVLHVDARHIGPADLTDGIVVNIAQRMLFVARDGHLVGTYPVAVGKPGWPSPVGTFSIIDKESDPTWDVPVSIQREMARKGVPVLTSVPPGPDNPLGDRFLRLSAVSVGIHGTNHPETIFHFTTHGCLRMHPDDVRALFELVDIGTTVRLVYEPVLLFVDDTARAWLEVHPDAYHRSGDLSRAAFELLENAGLSGAVDPSEVRKCVQTRQGRPCGL